LQATVAVVLAIIGSVAALEVLARIPLRHRADGLLRIFPSLLYFKDISYFFLSDGGFPPTDSRFVRLNFTVNF
jgi:hypothetical protein